MRHRERATRIASIDELTLTATEAKSLAELADELVPAFVGGEKPLPIGLLEKHADQLPAPIADWLGAARRSRSSHAVVLRGGPSRPERLDATPLHWADAQTPGSAFHACVLMLLTRHLGRPFGWKTQQAGRVVTDVVPSPGLENSLVSSSSHAELGWHTEDAFSTSRADFVGLSCLRSAVGGATTLSFLEPGRLDPDLLRVLAEPRFLVQADDAHDIEGRDDEPVPLVQDADYRRICVDRDFTIPVPGDDDAAAALQALIAAVDANIQDLPLAPGDVAFVDNALSVHGRRSFIPRFDGTDRWLKRVNIRAEA